MCPQTDIAQTSGLGSHDNTFIGDIIMVLMLLMLLNWRSVISDNIFLNCEKKH